MRGADPPSGAGRFQYAAVGHVTADVLEDGTRRPGGSAFYGAVQAARLGLRTLLVTRGRAPELEDLLAPHLAEIELRVLPAACTTTLATRGRGTARTQHVLAWAGAMPAGAVPQAEIVHLAPVANELGAGTRARARLVGLTPQGLVRRWAPCEQFRLEPVPGLEALGAACDAVVLSVHERGCCEPLIASALAGGAVVAITGGPAPNLILRRGAPELRLAVPPLAQEAEDLGAGDVFAAAFFIALAEGRDPAAAAAFANAAAAVRMSGTGAGAIGDRVAVERRLARAGGR